MFITDHRHLVRHFTDRADSILSSEWITTLLPHKDAETAVQDLRSGADYAFAAAAKAHRAGDPNATDVLIGTRMRALLSLTRYAHRGYEDERLQVCIEAYLSALASVTDTSKCASKTYYRALKTITKRDLSVQTVPSDEIDHELVEPVGGDDDAFVSAESVISFGAQFGLSDRDASVLRAAHCRGTKLPVRLIAAELDVPEDRLETQLRRARSRLRECVLHNSDHFSAFIRQHALGDHASSDARSAAAA